MRFVLCAAVLLLAGTAACNDCDFIEIRCNGNAVERCGSVDQIIGRTVERKPCEGLNPVCVQNGSDAFCAVSEARGCTVNDARCEGNNLVKCQAPGVEVAQDCTKIDVHLLDGAILHGRYVCRQPPVSVPAGCREP